jgi:hypothetical protein
MNPNRLLTWTRVSLVAVFLLLYHNRALAFERHFEVTPLFGFRAGGSFEDSVTGESLRIDEGLCYGVALDMDYNPDSQLQLLWTRQSTQIKTPSAADLDLDFTIDYVHFGSTYSWSHDDHFRPYVLLSVGATYFDPKESRYEDELRFSMGLGLGFKYYVTEHIGFVAEGRGFGTFMGGSSTIFCKSGEGCYLTTEQDLLLQFEAHAGIVFRF